MEQLLDTAEKIRTMQIRGAGRIAMAASAALRDYAEDLNVHTLEEFNVSIKKAARILVDTRPTAVSLPNAVMLTARHSSITMDEARAEIIANANTFIEHADQALDKMGRIGARRIRDGDVIMTHCNSHAALSVIKTAYDEGKDISVIATESRPRRQGLITIRELNDHGIPTTLIVDSAVRYCMKDVDTVVVGADVVTINGALVNKIGTSQLALAAHEARKNLIAVAETYKFSPRTLYGDLIDIEERSTEEVIDPEILAGLPHVRVKNPAFDITPAEYIDLIITEAGAFPPEMAYIVIKEHLGWDLTDME
ncbi:MAG: ribose 1,5-bisphosphate isomerase [Methanosarcinaceae archaeon]|nr:ribose 1,5-bisphosphate isomerase [Methanosarcinaceae archaeon]